MAKEDSKPMEDKPADGAKPEKKGGKGKDVPDELSEEDQALKANLELMVTRAQDADPGVQKLALEVMVAEIRSATSSMTSVPKPLKFLRPHYATLKSFFESRIQSQTTAASPQVAQNTSLLADVLSVLGMTMAEADDTKTPDSLRFRLLGSADAVGTWGHEYVRNLAGEVGREYARLQAAPAAAAAHVAAVAAHAVAAADASAASPPLPAPLAPAAPSPTAPLSELLRLVGQIVPFHMSHNSEPEAVDLLLEVDQLATMLPSHVTEANHGRTCLYLVACASYLPEPEDANALTVAARLYLQSNRPHDALRLALRLGSPALVGEAFGAAKDAADRRQMAFVLSRAGGGPAAGAASAEILESACATLPAPEREGLREALSNERLAERFRALGRDLDVLAPKTPEEIYKAHLSDGPGGGRAGGGAAAVDSARQNLSATFVSGLVNAGTGTDRLLIDPPKESEGGNPATWISRNKEVGKMAAAASLGLLSLWDIEGGLPLIDKYLYSTDQMVVAGALLAVGVVSTGVRSEVDPAFALLCDHVGNTPGKDACVRAGAILGLGLAYVGLQKAELLELLTGVVTDESVNLTCPGLAALSLGLSFVGSCNQDAAQAMLTCLMSRGETELAEPATRFLILGLGLLFLGRRAAVDATLEIIKTLPPHTAQYAAVVLDTCAYMGSGDVLKVQGLLAICGEHPEPPKAAEAPAAEPAAAATGAATGATGAASGAAPGGGAAAAAAMAAAAPAGPLDGWRWAHQGPAVLGLALVALGEDVGSDMALRALEHLLQYGEPGVRRAVPLALALLSASSPKMALVDTLGRLSHDPDDDVAINAIFAVGVIAAGSNNARVASMLRQLASYHQRDPAVLFVVRVAQGLVHAGKGLLTASPLHADRGLVSPSQLAGLLATLTCFFDSRATVLGKQPYLLFCIAASLQPRMLMTLDESGAPLAVGVRVGLAVDVVGAAGRPKTITGFQTHTTPVLLGVGERAELASDKYLAVGPVLEGIVILKPNPSYLEPEGGGGGK